jgi:hypothetical protein
VGRRIALSVALSFTVLATFAGGARADVIPGRLGVMVDAGVPDGFNGSVVWSPVDPLHVHAGLGTNLISMGLRAGATVFILPTTISPTASIELGHYFPGDANAAAERFGLGDDDDNPLLREIGYDYANFHLGVNVGRERFSFYLHAGFSALRGTLRNLDDAVEEDADPEITVQIGESPTASVILPSARLGLLFFF